MNSVLQKLHNLTKGEIGDCHMQLKLQEAENQ